MTLANRPGTVRKRQETHQNHQTKIGAESYSAIMDEGGKFSIGDQESD